MASYCTIADLSKELPETQLAGLAGDTAGAVIADAAVIAVINELIERASNEVRTYLVGRDVDLTDEQVLADCKRWTVALTLQKLFARRFQYPPSVTEAAKSAREQLKAIAAGEQHTGVTAQPVHTPTITTEVFEVTPVFSRDSDGDEPSLMERF